MKRSAWMATMLLLGLAGCDTGSSGDAGVEDGSSPNADTDLDTILDVTEGRAERRDTDHDGILDYLDTESDGDGLPDSFEAGDADLSTDPLDSDNDGVPDYLDLDSDDNGFPDEVEGTGDYDLDGIRNFADLDDDNDLVPDRMELAGQLVPPFDSDGDGIPNYRDPDSDDDGIMDGDEFGPDTDLDGLFDYEDLDTDADTIPDSIEAGDDDLFSPPVDSDGDTIPDFRDPDSDNDGLSDRLEYARGTDFRNPDTDGDGVGDLVEIAAGTDPNDPLSNSRDIGDFVFVVPYMEPPDPPQDTLAFRTNIAKADVYFLMDETGSMGGSITSLQSEIVNVMTAVGMVIPDAWFGLGGFRDYPVDPYGGGWHADLPYEHYLDMTNDRTLATGTVSVVYEPDGGDDGPESHTQAVWATATGDALPRDSGPRASSSFGPCPSGRFGWPCFRPDAVPIVVLITDVNMHNGPFGSEPYDLVPGAPTFEEAIDACVRNNVRVTGIFQTFGFGGFGRSDLEAMAVGTGAVDGTGRPLVEDYMSGSPITSAVVTNIETLATQSRLDVTAEFRDDPTDGVDTATAFFDHLVANSRGSAVLGCTARLTEDRDMDGIHDTFPRVITDTTVCFDIYVHQNDTVMSREEPQLFRAQVQVIGDGFTPLDTRDVYFLVPPSPPVIGGPE
ncbi:MAG: VWA domain-containing protein [Sandaracinaceae bacterium]